MKTLSRVYSSYIQAKFCISIMQAYKNKIKININIFINKVTEYKNVNNIYKYVHKVS